VTGRADRIRETCWYSARLFGGRHYRAVMALSTRAILENGDDPRLRLLRSRALLAMHRDGEAAIDAAAASLLDPSSAEPQLILCEIALRRGVLVRAEDHLGHALTLAPAHRRAAELFAVVAGWGEAAALAAMHRAAARSSAMRAAA
jgi:hypothetical protein